MIDFTTIFVTLTSGLLGYWFCGHCIVVARRGGPRGHGYEFYQRATHPVRFWLYVFVVGSIGFMLASAAIVGFFKIYRSVYDA